MTIDESIIDDIESSGVPTFKYAEMGDTFDVTISAVRKRQQTEFGTGKPLTWDDGNPRWEYEIVGTSPTGEQVRDFAKAQKWQAIKDAIKASGDKVIIGGHLRVKWASEEPAKTAGFNPRKVYAARYDAAPPVTPPAVDLEDF